MKENIVSKNKQLVIIDEGHGIDTPGKRAEHEWGVFFEWEYTRSLGSKACDLFTYNDINNIRLVDGNKDMPLEDRIRLVYEIKNKYVGWDIFLISLHGNAAGIEQANGYEIFTSPAKNKSDDIATVLYNEAEKLGLKMRHDWSDGDPDKESRFYMLTQSPVWAVLVEIGFYTNKAEAMRMLSQDFQLMCAYNLLNGVKRVFREVF